MTERRCIAMGRGAKEHPHFYFYDIDTKDQASFEIATGDDFSLVVESSRGYHVISPQPITDPAVLSIADPKCPGNAVRFYPHDDLKLVKRPSRLCRKVAKIYESIFNIPVLPLEGYDECDQPLKFGIYRAEKDGIKQLGDERLVRS